MTKSARLAHAAAPSPPVGPTPLFARFLLLGLLEECNPDDSAAYVRAQQAQQTQTLKQRQQPQAPVTTSAAKGSGSGWLVAAKKTSAGWAVLACTCPHNHG